MNKEMANVEKALGILVGNKGNLNYQELVFIKSLLTNYMVMLYKTQNKKMVAVLEIIIKWYELNGWYQRAERLKEKEKSIGVCTDVAQ
jgi:hypothetical protein